MASVPDMQYHRLDYRPVDKWSARRAANQVPSVFQAWVLAETEQDRRVRYESGLEAQANDLLIESYGAEPYIPFKSNTTGKGSGPAN